MKTIFIPFVTAISLWMLGCTDKPESVTTKNFTPSTLIVFDYLGYSDTTCATLYGQILHKGEKGDTVPLEDVEIILLTADRKTVTDSSGEFSICIGSGEYRVKLAKEGYQTVLLDNYLAKSDQVSTMKVLLEKGNDERKIRIPDEQER